MLLINVLKRSHLSRSIPISPNKSLNINQLSSTHEKRGNLNIRKQFIYQTKPPLPKNPPSPPRTPLQNREKNPNRHIKRKRNPKNNGKQILHLKISQFITHTRTRTLRTNRNPNPQRTNKTSRNRYKQIHETPRNNPQRNRRTK